MNEGRESVPVRFRFQGKKIRRPLRWGVAQDAKLAHQGHLLELV
jgi:hypothetical protein